MIRVGSAVVATLVTCLLIPILAPGNHKHAPALIIVSAVIMTCAGWLFVALKVRSIGIIHAALMLIVGGYLLSVGLPVLLDPRGMGDNAAAGVIALANLVVAVAGGITVAGGVAVFQLAFSSKGTDTSTPAPR